MTKFYLTNPPIRRVRDTHLLAVFLTLIAIDTVLVGLAIVLK